MFARARHILDDATMPVICPTSQILFPLRSSRCRKFLTARHDRRRCDHFGREPYPSRVEGPRAGAKRAPPAGAFAHAGNILANKARTTTRRPTAQAEGCGVLTSRAAVRSVKARQTKSPRRCFARARQILDDATMPVICPTSQGKESVTKSIGQIETDICNLRGSNDKARCRLRGAGFIIFAMMSICG